MKINFKSILPDIINITIAVVVSCIAYRIGGPIGIQILVTLIFFMIIIFQSRKLKSQRKIIDNMEKTIFFLNEKVKK